MKRILARIENKEWLSDTVMKLLWIAVIGVSIKSIFADTSYDNGYQIALSYRHLQGDKMFYNMLEPHQTSAFMLDALMWVYHLFVPSYTGVTLFLQLVSTLIFAGVCIPLYRIMKRYVGSKTAQLMCMFFILFRAKQTPLLEFSNLLILFSTLMFLSLIQYISEQNRIKWLIVSAVFLCLTVISYPGAVIMYLAAVFILRDFTEKKGRNVGLMTAVCALFGALYGGFFAFRHGLSSFFNTLEMIVAADSHIDGSVENGFWANQTNLLGYLIWIGIVALLSAGAVLLQKKKETYSFVFALLLLVSEIILVFFKGFGLIYHHETIYVLPVAIFALGLLNLKQLTKEERTLYICGNVISACAVIADGLLTDLQSDTYLPYFVVGCIVSFIPIMKDRKYGEKAVLLILCAVIFHRGVIIHGYCNTAGQERLWEVNNIVRNGPLKGIVCDTDFCLMNRDEVNDFKSYTNKEDKLMIVVDGWLYDPTVFMYSDAKIANPTVINTPVYREAINDYFLRFPEKRPTVVAVYSPYGFWPYDENEWMMQWLNKSYKPSDEGLYWKFYR